MTDSPIGYSPHIKDLGAKVDAWFEGSPTNPHAYALPPDRSITPMQLTDQPVGLDRLRPIAQLGWLTKALADLGIGTGFLNGVHRLALRAHEIDQELFARRQMAQQEREQAAQQVADDAGQLASSVAAWTAGSVWLDTPLGEHMPPAEQMAGAAKTRVEAAVANGIAIHCERIFAEVQRKATAVVAEVADLPTFRADIWISPAPAEDLAKIREHRASWGVLVAAYQDFESANRIAAYVRPLVGGCGPENLPGGAPRHALVFRNWRPLLADERFHLLKMPLRIRYAIDHGYEPGIWRPSDVEVSKADQTFRARLQNLGTAVGRVS